MKKTKIVCSISDLRCDEKFLRELFFAGMNVVRMNTAHADAEGIKKIIRNVRAVSPHIGILIDLKCALLAQKPPSLIRLESK